MNFQPDTVIQDHRGERRWKVVRVLDQIPQPTLWEVADQAENLDHRILHLMTLNHSKLSAKDRDFSIQSLRDAFQRMAEIIGSGSYTFLPEPVDWFTFTNNLDAMSPDLRREEPALVFVQAYAVQISPFRNTKDDLNLINLRKIIISALKTLKRLHDNQVVIQQLPLTHVRRNPVTHITYFTGIHTLSRMDDFCGYNRNRVTLLPEAVFSAPEAFDPRGSLTPATDVYAAGKLALQLILGKKYKQFFTPDNPFPADVQNIINSLNLPPPWPRFLSVCLQFDPAQRYQNACEAEIALMSEDRQEAIRKSQRESEQARQASYRQAQTKKQPAKQSPSASAKPNPHWVYSENPQLPTALLLIWGERLTRQDQQFNFMALYKDLMYRYNLKQRLFFQTCKGGSTADNPFFNLLEQQYRLNVIPMDGQHDPVGILNHALDPYLSTIRHLILVGNSDEAGVQCLLQHPNAPNWRIQWIRGAGNWNPSISVAETIDIMKYMKQKPAKKP
jgi:hypothetical protein